MVDLEEMNRVDPEEFVRGSVLVDVRTPEEFKNGHIPGSVNMPLFNDEERKIVGTIYKRQSREKAVLKGLEIAGPKQHIFLKQAMELSDSGQIHVYCWRGGMRSGSMAWLFSLGGLGVNVLNGGYKAYRNYVLEKLSEKYKLMVLGGHTGSGKTALLIELEKQGEQVIDLEGLANHRGSAFGGLGMESQPMTQHFENLLVNQLNKKDKEKRIWIEDESEMIGRVNINKSFFIQKKLAPVIFLKIDFDQRVKNLVEDYGNIDNSLLENSITKIKKRLGGQNYKEAKEFLNKGDIHNAAAICLSYYDKAYEFALKKKDHKKIVKYEPETYNMVKIAKNLIIEADKMEREIMNIYSNERI